METAVVATGDVAEAETERDVLRRRAGRERLEDAVRPRVEDRDGAAVVVGDVEVAAAGREGGEVRRAEAPDRSAHPQPWERQERDSSGTAADDSRRTVGAVCLDVLGVGRHGKPTHDPSRVEIDDEERVLR